MSRNKSADLIEILESEVKRLTAELLATRAELRQERAAHLKVLSELSKPKETK